MKALCLFARLIALALFVTSTAAIAASRTATFQVNAAIVTGCTVATDTGGRWGLIDLGAVAGVGSRSVNGALVSGGVGGIQLSCTPGTTVSLLADAGDNAAAGQRRLAGSGAAKIPYALFAGGSPTAWTTQAMSLSFPAGTSARVLPVTATATITGPIAAGTYRDTVRITLSF